jgi:UDP-N-acetyl-D-glucosamine/UDP-N-acetyl-D-galactosamine dehydrogenase
MNLKEIRISIIGLGYVGLPLALEFSKYFPTVGYDINKKRVQDLKKGIDKTNEVDENELKNLQKNKSNSHGLKITSKSDELKASNIYIITVPTPIDSNKKPNLGPLKSASLLISNFIKINDIIIYESTVYPGLTEEICVPILEKNTSFSFNKDFFVGYSPERINPGDKKRSLTSIKKIVSGSNNKTTDIVNFLYKKIIKAGTYVAPSIKVAEAAKVIENSQRDINIAFVNELSKIFNLLEIDTNEVLKAAETKWNFLPFKPGLVGGHCIGVDPYYLAQKAQAHGYHPEIILAGRRLNDSMGNYIASEVVKLMIKKDIKIANSKVLILGFTFKENCPDFRNTRVIDIVKNLIDLKINLSIFDPLISKIDVKNEYDIECLTKMPSDKFDAIILAVSHQEFLKIKLKNYLKKNSIIYDVKNFLKNNIDGSL